MKYICGIILVFITITHSSFGASQPDTDHTLIDCITWDDINAVAFNSSQPYQTLKAGIEGSIDYINTNINIPGNEATASGKIFSIKVNCSANNIADTSITLDFKGVAYNNEIILEGQEDNGLIINNTRFFQKYNSGNITFKNAKFMNAPGYYFYDEMFTGYSNNITPNSQGIKIENSSIQLSSSTQLWKQWSYNLNKYSYYPGFYKWYRRSGIEYYSYYQQSNQQNIQNSIIEIALDGDYDFQLPVYIKDSKIIFRNTGFGQNHTIQLLESWNPNSSSKLDYAVLVSNEIDIWGNTLSIENEEDIAFINNKIFHFDELILSANALYLNNTIENTSSINISALPYIYNTTFSGSITNTIDVQNTKHNYQNGVVGTKGLGWIFRRNNSLPYFWINITSIDIFKTITGIDIPNIYDHVYMIFQK